MRFRPLVQLIVMDQHRPWPQLDRAAIAERPFAAVAVARPDVAVDIEAPFVVDDFATVNAVYARFVPDPWTR